MKFPNTYLKAMQIDARRCGIRFTLKQIQTILDANPKHAQYIFEDCDGGEWELPITSGMDTAPREVFFSAIGHYFTGSEWPCYGDGEDTKFYKKLRDGLDKAKVKYS